MTEGSGMRVETAIGNQIARLRETRQMSLTQLGEALGRFLDRPWSRQAVHQAERGRRAFTAAELAALALALDTSVPALFLTDADQLELPGATISAEDYRESCSMPATTHLSTEWKNSSWSCTTSQRCCRDPSWPGWPRSG